jgi:integrase
MSQQDSQKRKYKRTESWGALRQLPSGRHQASYVHNGTRFVGPHPFDTKQDARAWLAGVRVDIQRDKWRDPRISQARHFGTYSDVWLTSRLSSKGELLRPRTHTEYRRQLDRGLAEFKPDRLSQITGARVRGWHSKRMKESGATAAAREAALLRAILTTAVLDELIDRNPVDPKLTRSSTGQKHRPPTLEELSAMVEAMAASAPHLKLAVLLAAYGGLRLSEWRALRRSDLMIDEDRVTVAVTRQAQRIARQGWVVGPPKSAEGIRMVPLPSSLTGDIHTHLSQHVGAFPGSLLFQPAGSSEFLHDTQFNVHRDKAREAAGVRTKEGDAFVSVVREHDLRHFHLSHFAQSGATLAELKARAGHSTTQAAMIYQHALVDRGAELADAMPQLSTAKTRLASIR